MSQSPLMRESPRVIISGASSGIGRALTEHYALRGATLGLIARREWALQQLAVQLGVPARIYPLDVRDASAIAAAAEDFMSRHGCPDAVIAAAGISIGTLTECSEDQAAFQDVLDINVVGTAKTFHPFIACMRKNGRGTLAAIASVAGYRGLPGAGAYSASKAALISYLESLRVELAHTGIKVVTICPGYVATPMTAANPYPMPFLMSADAAAGKIVSAIEKGKSYAVIPWQMAIVARMLRVLPNWLYDRLFANAPRKPRRRNGS